MELTKEQSEIIENLKKRKLTYLTPFILKEYKISKKTKQVIEHFKKTEDILEIEIETKKILDGGNFIDKILLTAFLIDNIYRQPEFNFNLDDSSKNIISILEQYKDLVMIIKNVNDYNLNK